MQDNTIKHSKLRVGLLRSPRIECVVDGVCRTITADDVRDKTVTIHAGKDGLVTLKDVVIGIGFHWERKEDQTFMGDMECVLEDGEVRVINVVGVEDYLLSVISSEMSAKATPEFLKAHAVISRSWVMRKMMHGDSAPEQDYVSQPDRVVRWYGTESHKGFHVCADDHCQRYQGVKRAMENADNWNKVKSVIDATRGQVLLYDGVVCDARFSKCCGGVMEEFSACWEDVDMPYLVAKADSIGDSGAFCDTSDPAVLSQVMNDYDLETRDFYRWQVRYRPAELSALVKQRSGLDLGNILSLEPVKRGKSGRIVELRITGDKRSVTVGKELEIRKWLSTSHLYSSAFSIERDGETFVLNGRGWGHGVGLCQIGAAAMGLRGYDYKQILKHYYPNTTLDNPNTTLDNPNTTLDCQNTTLES